MRKENFLVTFVLILPVTTIASTYTFNDGNNHNQNFTFSSGTNYINIDNNTKLTSNITLNNDYSSIEVKKNSIIDANITSNVLNANSNLTLNKTRQNNKFVIYNDSPSQYSSSSVINPYMVGIYSSNAEYEIYNNGY